MSEISLSRIEMLIYVLRGQKVMLDSDLAELYEVPTKALIQAMKRNAERFPEDFAFECTFDELDNLRSQFVTANPAGHWNYMRRTVPVVFTESGVAMLSSVLNSSRAIQVNISIIRVFVRLRSFMALENANSEKVTKLEKNTNKLFKIVFERLDSIEEIVYPKISPQRKKIGIKKDEST